MRIAVIADTHIPERAKAIPPGVLKEIKEADMVIHAGDFTDVKVLEDLRRACKELRAVWGNMDSQELKAMLPQKDIIKFGRYKIGLMHGYGNPAYLLDSLKQEFKNDNVDLVIFGHSHRPFSEKIDGVWYFNPGSLTDDIFTPYKSYGMIEINDRIQARIIKI